MIIEGARIYNEGVTLGHDCEEKIRQIMAALNSVSSAPEVSVRLLKTGKSYEGLLWGMTDKAKIGLYNRGPSASHVLETLYKKVKKQFCQEQLAVAG
jgi:hypothetical protein